MHAKLVVVGGDAKAAEIRLKLPTIVGRGRGASLTLPHPLVSRQHCEIVESDGRLLVRDLGSLNGTYIGNERITEAILPPGELLTIGTVTFRAVYEEQPGGPNGRPAARKSSTQRETPASPQPHSVEGSSGETLDVGDQKDVGDQNADRQNADRQNADRQNGDQDPDPDEPLDFMEADETPTVPQSENEGPIGNADPGIPAAQPAGQAELASQAAPANDIRQETPKREPSGSPLANATEMPPIDDDILAPADIRPDSHPTDAASDFAASPPSGEELQNLDEMQDLSEDDVDLFHEDSGEFHLGEDPDELAPEEAGLSEDAGADRASGTDDEPKMDATADPSDDQSDHDPSGDHPKADADDDLQSFLRGLQ